MCVRVHVLTTLRTQTTLCRYLIGQVKAGAQILQIFESHSGELTPVAFEQFLLPRLARIADGVKSGCAELGLPEVPMVVFAKGAHYALESLAQTRYSLQC